MKDTLDLTIPVVVLAALTGFACRLAGFNPVVGWLAGLVGWAVALPLGLIAAWWIACRAFGSAEALDEWLERCEREINS